MAGGAIRTSDEVARAIATAPLLAEWTSAPSGPGALDLSRGDTTLILVWPETWRDRAALAPHLARARTGRFALVAVGTAEELGEPPILELGGDLHRVHLLAMPAATGSLAVWLRGVGESERLLRELADRELTLERSRFENELLIDIGRALSRQRDLAQLFDLILRRAREVTGADAGSIYVVEGDDADVTKRVLRFVESQNDSLQVTSEGFTLPVSSASIVGACVLGAEVINIPDLYAETPETGRWRRHDRSFDKKTGYQTRSMITVPMISARGQVIGVIQLINKRARGVTRLHGAKDFETKILPFDAVSTEYATALASQAGIALENALLNAEVRALFDGFVRASVTAIEARDPTTSGHSERVATLTVGLAQIADQVTTGPYAELKVPADLIKQIEYAALLHDFGKVGVRENVLVKAKKLYEHDRQLIEARFDYIRKAMQAEHLESKVRAMAERSRAEVAEQLVTLDRDAHARIAELDDLIAFILQANQPTVLEQGGFERISEIAQRTFRTPSGETRPFLTPDECHALQIARGSLTEGERREIESHVTHTYNFLRQIPWGKTFRDVPEIAGAHHEKLDGTGYPHGRKGVEIPPAARMMAIADIYDALTAADRPYKRAVPIPKALDIIGSEVDRGKLDRDLFDLFVGAKVWERLGPTS